MPFCLFRLLALHMNRISQVRARHADRRRSGPSGNRQQCQKCLGLGHWTFECKGERVYVSRPSRTEQIKKGRKLQEVREMKPPEMIDYEKKLELLRKKKGEKHDEGKSLEHRRSSTSSNDDSSSSDSSSESGNTSSSEEEYDSEVEARRRRRLLLLLKRKRESQSSADSESDVESTARG